MPSGEVGGTVSFKVVLISDEDNTVKIYKVYIELLINTFSPLKIC